VVIAATLLTVLASWIPAVIAAAQDPAVVLREE
jgi:ABC-type lipoprotein release transport system permease subunit